MYYVNVSLGKKTKDHGTKTSDTTCVCVDGYSPRDKVVAHDDACTDTSCPHGEEFIEGM